MLGKLFKYDMKALGRVFLPLYAALIIVSAVNRGLMLTGLTVPIIIGNSVFGMLMGGVCVATLILTIYRFRKNLLGNEGYLSFTLPVSADKLILSKMFSAAIWSVASFIAVIASIIIIGASGSDFTEFIDGLKQFFSHFHLDWNHVIFSIDAIIIMVLMLFCSIMVLYCCISLSMLVNKHRKAFSFGAFIVITIVAQIIGAILVNACMHFDPIQLSQLATAHVILGLVILGELVVFGIFYSATRFMLTKKLNLE